MHTDIDERAVRLAEYIIDNTATVRAAAKQFGVSKSTVQTVVTLWYVSVGSSDNVARMACLFAAAAV